MMHCYICQCKMYILSFDLFWVQLSLHMMHFAKLSILRYSLPLPEVSFAFFNIKVSKYYLKKNKIKIKKKVDNTVQVKSTEAL